MPLPLFNPADAISGNLNTVFQSANNDGIAQGSPDLASRVTGFFQHGIVDAATSGAVGVYNSLKGVANMFGAELPMTNTADVISGAFGKDATDYYAEHKVQADAAGFAATVVPAGIAAVSGLRALQAGGIANLGFRAATGFTGTDIVLGSEAAAGYRAAVVANPANYSWVNPKFIGAVGWAARQNVQEALVAEGVIIVTHNQSPIINPNSLDAWDASYEAFTSGLPLLLVGGAGGLLIDAVRLRGSARSAFKATEAGNLGKMQVIGTELGGAGAAITPGDVLLGVGKAKAALASPEYAVGTMDELRTQFGPEATDGLIQNAVNVRLAKAANQLKDTEENAMIALNAAGEVGVRTLQTVHGLQNETDRLSILGNLNKVSYISHGESEQLAGLTSGLTPLTGKSAAGLQLGGNELQNLADISKRRLLTSSRAQAILTEGIVGNGRLWKELSAYAAEYQPQLAAALGANRIAAKRLVQDAKLAGLPQTAAILEKNLAAGKKLFGAEDDVATLLKQVPATHAVDAVELLSKAAASLQDSSAGAVVAAKYPTLAKAMREAGLAKSAAGAYYNVRTGKVLTYLLPRANDTHAISYTQNGIEAVVHATGKDRLVLPYRADATKPKAVLKAIAADEEVSHSPIFDVSAHYVAASTRKLSPLNGRVTLASTDVPMLERAATLAASDPEVAKLNFVVTGKGFGSGKNMSATELQDYVLQRKRDMRTAYQAAGLNEHQIAVLTNSGMDFARGLGDGDALLMGKLDMTKPETVGLRYRDYGARNVDLAARTATGLDARLAAINYDRQVAASTVLGADYNMLPAEDLQLLKGLSQTEQKAGLVTQQLSSFGSFREWASYVGSLVHGIIDKGRLAIETDFVPHYNVLAVRSNVSARAQYSLLMNTARGAKLRVFDLQGEMYAVDDVALEAHINEVAADMTKAIGKPVDPRTVKAARDIVTSDPAQLEMIVAKRNNSAIRMLPDVANLVRMQMSRNAQFIQRDRALAAATGHSIQRDPQILYPPPLNLRRTPHFAFVVPTEANAELPSFMIYGAEAKELDLKRAYVAERYGPRYQVVGSADAKRYKQLQGAYEKGDVFNEWDFDSNLQRVGTAKNFQPSLDLDATEALDLTRNWMHRKNERQIKQAVELKYADTVKALKMADKAYDVSAVDSLTATRATERTIFGDTLRVLTSSDSATGVAVTGYRRINDWIGENGSKVLDASVAAITHVFNAATLKKLRSPEAVFDEPALAKLTQELEDSGLVNPYDNLTTAMARSKVITDGRSLMQATRVLNTLVAGTTLRLDWWNSLVQVMSVPVLTHSIMMEAKTALAGTSKGKQLAALTTVVNPGTGLVEPTAGKLFMRAVKAMFTDEGKAFQAELRKRFILDDPLRVYLEAQDFGSLNGRHTLSTVQQKIDDFIQIAQKPFMHRLSEDMSRFIVAHAFKEIAELRGYKGEEMYAVIRNGVDRVHGIHRAHGKFQLFNGVLGQTVGLFQTYMWNVAQQMLRHVEDGNTAAVAKAAFIQSTLFGVRSLPAFHTLNGLVAGTNDGKLDLYSLAGTDDDPNGFGKYVMYGAASNILPADLFSRGEFALRYNTVLPLNPMDWPAISVVSKAVGNVFQTASMMPSMKQAVQDPSSVLNALSYGLAHNGLNRPLAGWGQLMGGMVTTKDGTPLFVNTNYTNYDPSEGFNASAIAARFLGGKPTAEAIMLDSYYRRVAYQTEQRSDMNKLGARMRMDFANGANVSDEQLAGYVAEYEAAGGGIENFHSYFGRQLGAANQSSVESFKQKLQTNSAFSRAYGRLAADRSMAQAWTVDAKLQLPPE